MSISKVYLEMMKAGYEHGFVFPRELMLHAKALTTAEALVFVLAPSARFEELSRPFIAREYVGRAASLELLERRMSQLAPELLLLGEMPPPEAIDDEWDWQGTTELVGALRDRLGDAIVGSLQSGGLWKTLLEAHARAALRATSLADVADDVLGEAWHRYYEIEPTLAVAPTLGAVFTTHLAAATLAIHWALVGRGLRAEESYRVIYDIGWRFYTQMAEPPLMVAAAFTRDGTKRLRMATDLFRLFPFGSPSYGWREVPSGEGAVAFDCTKCPVADFFARHQSSELCAKTWCNLDFPLAEKWGGRLERTGTIAMGAKRCDFRWRVGAPASDERRSSAQGL
jgi:ubiquinone biosynthesis protein